MCALNQLIVYEMSSSEAPEMQGFPLIWRFCSSKRRYLSSLQGFTSCFRYLMFKDCFIFFFLCCELYFQQCENYKRIVTPCLGQNEHREQVRLSADNVDQTPAPLVQRLDGP
ncbi:hypothetical protein AMECASPLE_038973 [Ameca splendens]|uniref:Uncharacterized protein n=1 Tax=Ameca splendens TaxID=208324 RepID=A0ABV1A4U2_9TELE